MTELTKKPSINLTTQQLHILKIIYKFRFVTSNLIAKYRDVRINTTNEALAVLLQKGLIARRYDKSYKLLGKGARYFLTPNASKLLKPEPNINERVLHARYKDKTVGESFVEQAIEIMTNCLDIRSSYPDTFTIFSKAETTGHDFLPESLPDLYLRRNTKSEEVEDETNRPSDYFIDIISDNLFFIIKKRINQYFDHYESGEWGSDNYPTVLLICQNKNAVQKANKYIQTTLDDKYLYDYELPIKAIQKNELISNIEVG